ncbi:hypothetical protein NLJ89_g10118 [Agrocybe chaxingu]|uniref:Uncharacterized protein n=1 Tax=Agrocybe chaxingu TaxID=84603 RepID=A0A9W8MR74_9AGAR|nr:hypothetical protein NLJ89_g10118 [Agrocybe chaxingu]
MAAPPAAPDTNSWLVVHTLQLEEATSVAKTAFHPLGSILALGDVNGSITFQLISPGDWHIATFVSFPSRLLVVNRHGGVIVIAVDIPNLVTARVPYRTYCLRNMTDDTDVELSAVDNLGVELSVIAGRRLAVYGNPFEREFSYASKCMLPPGNDPALAIFKTAEIVSLEYVGRESVAIGFTVGILLVSTARPHEVLKSFVSPAFQRPISHVAIARTRRKMAALTTGGGYELVQHNTFMEGDAYTRVSSISAAGIVLSSFTSAVYLPDGKDTLILGGTSSEVLVGAGGAPQLLHLTGVGTNVHKLDAALVEEDVVIAAIMGVVRTPTMTYRRLNANSEGDGEGRQQENLENNVEIGGQLLRELGGILNNTLHLLANITFPGDTNEAADVSDLPSASGPERLNLQDAVHAPTLDVEHAIGRERPQDMPATPSEGPVNGGRGRGRMRSPACSCSAHDAAAVVLEVRSTFI